MKRLELVKNERGMASWVWLVVLVIVLAGAILMLKLSSPPPAPEPSPVVARGKIQPMPAPNQADQAEAPQKDVTEEVALQSIKNDDTASPAVAERPGQAPELTESNAALSPAAKTAVEDAQAVMAASADETGKPPSNAAVAEAPENAPPPDQPAPSAEAEAGSDHEGVEARGAADKDDHPETRGERKTSFAVQVGAFHNKRFAENMTSHLKGLGYPAFIFEGMNKNGQPLYQVRFGDFPSRDTAARSAVVFREKEKTPVLVVVSKSAE